MVKKKLKNNEPPRLTIEILPEDCPDSTPETFKKEIMDALKLNGYTLKGYILRNVRALIRKNTL